MSLQITAHAKQRIKERFNTGSLTPSAWAKAKWAKAKFVAHIFNEHGKQVRLFAAGNVLFVVDEHKDIIITVMQRDENRVVDEAVRKAALSVLKKAAKRSEREQRAIERLRAAIEIELGQRRLELMRTRSQSKRLAIQARIAALEERLAEIPDELIEAKRTINKFARGVAAYV